MKFHRKFGHGWFLESQRHSLAARGISSRSSFAKQAQTHIFETKVGKQEQRIPGVIEVRVPGGYVRVGKDGDAEDKKYSLQDKAIRGLGRRGSEPISTPKTQYESTAAELRLRAILRKYERADFDDALTRLSTGELSQDVLSKVYSNAIPRDEVEALNDYAYSLRGKSIEQQVNLVEARAKALEAKYVRVGGRLTDAEKILLEDAAFKGAQRQIDLGKTLDYKMLKEKFFLTDKQVNELKALDIAKNPSNLRKVGRVVGTELDVGATKLGGLVKRGAVEASKEVLPDAKEVVPTIGYGAHPKETGILTELDEGQHIFNPLKMLQEEVPKYRDGEKSARQKEFESVEKLNKWVDSIANNKAKLAKVDLSPFDRGEQAFRSGDREGLLDAITKLDTQKVALHDNWVLVDSVRQKAVYNDSNVQKQLGGESEFGAIPNFLFSSGGAGKYDENVRKLTGTMDELRKSSNGVASRISVLRSKLNRMDQVAPRDTEVPHREVKIVRDNSVSGFFSKPEQTVVSLPAVGQEGIGSQQGVQKQRVRNPVFEFVEHVDNPVVSFSKEVHNPVLTRELAGSKDVSVKNPVWEFGKTVRNPVFVKKEVGLNEK